MELLNASLIDWSRAQFAMTAMYHWLFVPLTLGLGVMMAIMETMYVRTGELQWKNTAKFWQKIFGINFAIGVATGLILEFQFGTNWSNYSYFVGDIFGAPLAIEGILAFFMEATFISIMFFGWKRVSKGAHLAATWLTILGATISAWWILVANGWMQNPVGMEFNPLTSRNEMVDFFAVALSPIAVNKFFHTVISSWILGAAFVVAVAAWYFLKDRDKEFATQSMKIASAFGLIACILTLWTGHGSAQQVAEKQPMKLAVMEGLYEGGQNADLIIFAIPNPSKEKYNDDTDPYLFPPIALPGGLSFLSYSSFDAYIPGIKNIIEGGYTLNDGTKALSFEEKKAVGEKARTALRKFKEAEKEDNKAEMAVQKEILDANYSYFGYGFLDKAEELIPHIGLTYWAFHIMIYSCGAMTLIFLLLTFFIFRKQLASKKWLLWVAILLVPMAYAGSQAGWVVAEVGRQPWAIQDVLPLKAAVSAISTGAVKTTFFLFLTLFTLLLVAEIGIMINQIKKGPSKSED